MALNRALATKSVRHDAYAEVPAFPHAASYALPLRRKAEASGSREFTPLWSGQAGPLGRDMPAGKLTTLLAEQTLERLLSLGG